MERASLGMLNRYSVKWIRDKVKSNYPMKKACEICNSTEELHFHHFYSLAEMFNKWEKARGYKIETNEEILAVRDEFIKEHWEQLVNKGACLCKKHHEGLHKVYGKNPSLATAEKQERWVEKQREKYAAKEPVGVLI